ncbi:PHD finger protein ING1-like [Salvia divinorum]|uniref:PHD finger protein ING1-like n=1 Tax=Salvia divinorum TaxID=28513 RepID=A0ABD1GVZ1_SALDI
MKRGIKSGSITPNSSLLKFTNDAIDEQKHAIRIANEKVALAVQAYDLVDTHIQQLDQYLKKFDEDLRRAERDAMAATPPTHDNTVKAGRSGETSNRGRKKTRLATANAAAASSSGTGAMTAANTSMELDLPVDPNEPTYCLCNQVSYGEMVACDNPDCKIEWKTR